MKLKTIMEVIGGKTEVAILEHNELVATFQAAEYWDFDKAWDNKYGKRTVSRIEPHDGKITIAVSAV